MLKQNININLNGVDFRDAMDSLAEIGGINIIVGEEVSGTLTAKLENVGWDVAKVRIALSITADVRDRGTSHTKPFVLQWRGKMPLMHGCSTLEGVKRRKTSGHWRYGSMLSTMLRTSIENTMWSPMR